MTADSRSTLRQIPAVEALLRHAGLDSVRARLGGAHLTRLVREVLETARQEVLSGGAPDLGAEALAGRVACAAEAMLRAGLTRVVNASGVILHTNLGRAPLSARALDAVRRAGEGYSDVEYDLVRGERGARMSHLERLITFLTGAEAALVVNNNAAAVLLALNSLAQGREVLVSRGELVEIGGSFRIPDVMEKSGARLREVGTTNKTHPKDYEKAIGGDSALLLKVHASNYRIEGFTAEVTLPQLARIGEAHGLPVMVDVGSGALLDVSPHGAAREPLVAECLAQGADLVTFSGDKLLGGPQAGLVVGRADLIRKLRANPLARAVRIDKLTLAALAATLVDYLDPETAWRAVPTLRMIAEDPAALELRAGALRARMDAALNKDAALNPGTAGACRVEVAPAETAVGGGALPLEGLKTWVVAVALTDREKAGGSPADVSPDAMERALRAGDPPVVARIQADKLLFDLRTLTPEEAEELPELVARALRRARGNE